MRLRSAALRSLPGPTYGLLGLFKALASKDPHRWSALWANEFGPIVKVRIFVFHVSINLPALLPAPLYLTVQVALAFCLFCLQTSLGSVPNAIVLGSKTLLETMTVPSLFYWWQYYHINMIAQLLSPTRTTKGRAPDGRTCWADL